MCVFDLETGNCLIYLKIIYGWLINEYYPQKFTDTRHFAPGDNNMLCSDLKVTRTMLVHPKQ